MSKTNEKLNDLAQQCGAALAQGSMPALRYIHMEASTNLGVLFRHQLNADRACEFMCDVTAFADQAVKLWQDEWNAKNR